jgi:hypothetical protein
MALRHARAALVAPAGALLMVAFAASALAATEIDIGQGQPSGQYGGCADPAPQCVYVQAAWDPDQVGDNPDGLPFGGTGVVTHVRIRF